MNSTPDAGDPGSSEARQLADEGEEPNFSFNRWFDRARSWLPVTRGPAPEEPHPGAAASVAAIGRAQQRLLVANVHRLGETRISEAMVPRADIVAVDVTASFRQVVEAFRGEGHSRLPIYQDSLDDTLGFIHVKDVLLACEVNEHALNAPSFLTRRYLRRLLTVPPSMYCGVLLQKMQAERVHMALVIDEFGGVDGLVTIEDLLELIVGDIEDEHDAASEAGWSREGEGIYRVDARTYLEDFEKEIGVQLLDAEKLDDVDTLGGLVFMLCNRVPARGEVIRHPGGHEFEILDADPRRIKQLMVTLASGQTGVPDSDAHGEAAQ